jgi:hypothetical protein
VRLRQRRRRGLIVGVLTLIYLAAFTWLVSPAWRAPTAARSDRVPVKLLSVDGSAGFVRFGRAPELPASLPGSTEATPRTTEGVDSEPVVESEPESAVSSPVAGETQASPPSAGESGGQAQETIISSEE